MYHYKYKKNIMKFFFMTNLLTSAYVVNLYVFLDIDGLR